ncbi:hypothetical protein NEDG_01456 [Nematocida displodere]|uniref:Uncharacterized protein n=1 Tax=Nematocida displodere TaxID=1805483 RepID=A0A177EFY6_9MICR|nr:hypothetical protein NEDG_01456 [Nematocida displodere]
MISLQAASMATGLLSFVQKKNVYLGIVGVFVMLGVWVLPLGRVQQPPADIEKMINLFRMCGASLETEALENGQFAIMPTQTQPKSVNLDRCATDAIPARMATDVVFQSLTIFTTAISCVRVKNFLSAFDTLKAKKLVVTDFSPTSFPETQQPKTLTTIETSHLTFSRVTPEAIEWFFSRTNMSTCVMALVIEDMPGATELFFLDPCTAKSVAGLTLSNIPNLRNVNTTLLKSGRVNTSLIFTNLSPNLFFSQAVTERLARVPWALVKMDLRGWSKFSETTRFTSIDSLEIVFDSRDFSRYLYVTPNHGIKLVAVKHFVLRDVFRQATYTKDNVVYLIKRILAEFTGMKTINLMIEHQDDSTIIAIKDQMQKQMPNLHTETALETITVGGCVLKIKD